MSTLAKLPVVVGAGLAGLLISRRLAEEGIEHILLGRKPEFAGPVLGESMNFVSSVEIDRFFQDDKDCTYPKEWIFLHGFGTNLLAFDFKRLLTSWPGLHAYKVMLGADCPKLRLTHLDRLLFDPRLYARVTALPEVRRVDNDITNVDYDPGSDRITALHLNDGSVLEPSCVFDATNGQRLLGRALNIPLIPIGGLRHVYYAHYHGQCGEEELWQRATNMLSIDAEGLRGLAWAIPLGHYVSVGVSLYEVPADMDAEEVMAATIRAYARRGMDILARFPERGRVLSHPHRYYTHERAFGANYLLASGSMAQINFASSTGVTTAIAAAEVAGRFARGDAEIGAAYQAFMQRVVSSHVVFDGLEANGFEPEISVYLSREWFMYGMRRVSHFYTLKTSLRTRWAATFLLKGLLRFAPRWIWVFRRFARINDPELKRQFPMPALALTASELTPGEAGPGAPTNGSKATPTDAGWAANEPPGPAPHITP